MTLNKIVLAFCCFLQWISLSYCQINRPYEPIVLRGDTLAQFSSYKILTIIAYAYRATDDTWNKIAFQIDEIDSSAREEDKYFKTEPDSLLRERLDSDDELVFMARDLGDKAPTNRWIEHADSFRYELEFIDPLDGNKSYLYLYHLLSTPDTVSSRIYNLSYENDRITAETYEVGFNETGQLADVTIKQVVGGSGQDIFDRIKIRLYGLVTFIIPFPVPINESSLVADSAYAKVGPVRIIRNLTAHFYYDLGILEPFDEPFIQTSFFYPYSSSFSITGIPIADLQKYADLLYARLSWDMNNNATGMSFYSELNRKGIVVDGSGEHENINVTSKKNDLDWTMISGAQGTILNIFYVPALGDSQGIFYYDNQDSDPMTNGDPKDFQPFLVDTGDSLAYGDNGYFLPPYFEPDSASKLCAQSQQPLTYYTRPQKYEPISKVVASATPEFEFQLYQNYPNPFNRHTIIPFSLSKPNRVSLIIYDMLGKPIKKIVDNKLIPGNRYEYPWSGDDDQGKTVASGLYFCQLKVANHIVTRKIILIK